MQITFHEKFKQSETSAVYAVFDGHAGFQAAHYCQQNLIKKVE